MFITSGNQAIRHIKHWVTCAGGFLLMACSPPHQPVNLAGNSWLGYQPLFVSQVISSGEDGSQHLELHSLPASSNVIRLMAESQLDGGLLTLDETLRYQQTTDDPLCVAMVMDISLGADALIMQPQWERLAQPLRIAHEASAVGGYMLHRALQHNAFAGREIRTAIVNPNAQVEVFKSGQVDGLVSFYPTLGELRELDSEIIFDSADIAGEIVDLLVIKSSVWQQHQTHIGSIIKDKWERAVKGIRAGDEKVMQRIAANTGMSVQNISRALQQIELIGAMDEQEFALNDAVEKLEGYMLVNNLLQQKETLDYCSSGAQS